MVYGHPLSIQHPLEDPGIFFVSGPSQGAFFVPHAPRFSAAAAREALAQPVDCS